MSSPKTTPIEIPAGSVQIGNNAIISKEGIRRCCASEVDVLDKEAIIKSVKDVAEGLGYSSYMISGRDDFDHKCTGDGSTYSIVIQGGLCKNLEYPYDLIQYRQENKWLIRCTNIYFRIFYNIIPYHHNHGCYDCNFTTEGLGSERALAPEVESIRRSHNIFKVPRSSGIPCEAILVNSKGIRFCKPNSNLDSSVDNLLPYLFSSFNMDGSELDLSVLYGLAHKCVLIDDVAEHNSGFSGVNIKFTLFSESEIANSKNETQGEVMRYFNELHREWFTNTCTPILKKVSKVAIKVYEKKGDENSLVYSQE